MKALPTTLDLDHLRAELEALDYEPNAYGIRRSIEQEQPIPDWAQRGTCAQALTEITSLTRRTPRHLMASIMPTGLELPVHVDRVDADPDGQRWHLPVVTNPGCSWWDQDGGSVVFARGFWWGPCPDRTPHTFANLGRTQRLHLIVELA